MESKKQNKIAKFLDRKLDFLDKSSISDEAGEIVKGGTSSLKDYLKKNAASNRKINSEADLNNVNTLEKVWQIQKDYELHQIYKQIRVEELKSLQLDNERNERIIRLVDSLINEVNNSEKDSFSKKERLISLLTKNTGK